MPDISFNNQRLAKNSLFLTIRMVIVLAISLYTTRLVLRVLGVEDYGVYNVVCGFVSMFVFLNTSMSNAIQRFFNYELGKNGEDGARMIYSTALYIQLQAPYTASVIAHERMDFYAVVSVFDAVLKLGIVLMLPFMSGDTLIWYGFFISLISIVNFLLYFLYSKHNFTEIKFVKRFDNALFKSMLNFTGWNLFGSFSGMMQEQGINLVINFFFGPIVNAARGVAVQVNAGLEGFVTNITMPVRPQVVQSYAKGDDRRMMNLTFSISKLSCCFLLMMAVPVSVEINYVLRLWLGDNVPDYAAIFTVIILIGSLISNLNAATSNVVHATGDMKKYQFYGSIIKISSIPIAFFSLKFYQQAEWALIIVMVCRLIGHIVGLFIVRKLVNMSLKLYTVKVIIPIAIVAITTIAVAILFRLMMQEGFLRLVCVVVVSVASVGLSLYYLALDNNEKQLFLQLLNRLINKIKRN